MLFRERINILLRCCREEAGSTFTQSKSQGSFMTLKLSRRSQELAELAA